MYFFAVLFLLVGKAQSEVEQKVWMDFLADTGDGFLSTLTVASTVAQPSLDVRNGEIRSCNWFFSLYCGFGKLKHGEERYNTTRGKHLIIGGDLVYPEPSWKDWKSRFVRPFSLALHIHDQTHELRRSTKNPEPPMVEWLATSRFWTAVAHIITSAKGLVDFKSHSTPDHVKAMLQDELPNTYTTLHAVLGNHDALDGGSTFRRGIVFRTLLDDYSAYSTPQNATHFLFEELGWLFVGLNDQQNAGEGRDIDVHQCNDVLAFLEQHPQQPILLFIHQPFWLYYERYPGPLLERLLKQIFPRVKAIIAGDLHYYAHWAPTTKGHPHLIVSGGGGAFLHSTAHVNQSVGLQLGDSVVFYNLTEKFPSDPSMQSVIQHYALQSGFNMSAIVCFFLGLCHMTGKFSFPKSQVLSLSGVVNSKIVRLFVVYVAISHIKYVLYAFSLPGLIALIIFVGVPLLLNIACAILLAFKPRHAAVASVMYGVAYLAYQYHVNMLRFPVPAIAMITLLIVLEALPFPVWSRTRKKQKEHMNFRMRFDSGPIISVINALLLLVYLFGWLGNISIPLIPLIGVGLLSNFCRWDTPKSYVVQYSDKVLQSCGVEANAFAIAIYVRLGGLFVSWILRAARLIDGKTYIAHLVTQYGEMLILLYAWWRCARMNSLEKIGSLVWSRLKPHPHWSLKDNPTLKATLEIFWTCIWFVIGGLFVWEYLLWLYLMVNNQAEALPDVFSFFAVPEFNNFLRLELSEKAIRIYPIGILRLLTGDWQSKLYNGLYYATLKGGVVDKNAFLIESVLELRT